MNIATLWFAADVSIKATAILLAAWALCAIIRSAPSSRRHLIWFLSLACILLMPVLCVVLPEWRVLPNWTGAGPQSAHESTIVHIHAEAPAESATTPVAVEPSQTVKASHFTEEVQKITPPPASIMHIASGKRSIGPAPIFNFGEALLGLWVIGLGLLLSRIALARISLLRLAARSAGITHGEIAALFAEASRDLCVRRRTSVLMSDDRAMPMTWGILRPKILLPADARGWSRDRLHMALLHELAHVKRWDAATQLVGQLACAVFWFHPLAWVASRGLLREQEQAADDLVLARYDRPADYASFLLDVARMVGARSRLISGSIAMARQATIENRLKAVLDKRRRREAMTWWHAIIATIAVLPILVLTASLRAKAAAPSDTTAGQTQATKASKVFSGKIVSPDGKPVGDAEIVLQSPRLETVARGRSRADGTFEIAGDVIETENYRPILVARVGNLGYGAIRARNGNENVIHINPCSSVRVTLLSPEGKPVAGIKVWPTYSVLEKAALDTGSDRSTTWGITYPDEWSPETMQTTGADGSCELPMLPQQSQTSLHVDGGDFAEPLVKERIQTGAGKESLSATVHLKYGGAIEGKVTYKDTGKPAAGIRLLALADRRIGFSSLQAITNERGEYHIAHLLPGKFVVRLLSKNDFPWTASFLSNVAVEARQTVKDQNLQLIKGTLVTGRVIKGDMGAGIPNVGVGSIDLSTREYPGSTQTDADGNYALRVPPGNEAVYLSSLPPEGYSLPGSTVRGGMEINLIAVDGQDQKIDFKLVPATGKKLTGRVLDPQGKPVAAAVVVLENPAGPPLRTTSQVKADADGTFILRGVEKGFRVYASADSLGMTEPIELKGDEKELVLHLSRIVKTQLAGRVVDGKGKPLANVGIYVTTWHGTFGLTPKAPIVLTDADGRFTLPGPSINTRYLLKARASDGRESAQRTIEYTPNTPDYELGDLHLEN